MPRTRSKPKQTRLTFTPIASPAPDEGTGKDKSPRPAKVRYDHPSVVIHNRPSSSQNHSDSAPAKKSPELEKESILVSSEDNDTKVDKRSRKRKSSAPSEHDDSEENDDDEIITKPRRKLRRGTTPKPTIVLDDDSDDDVIISSPAKRRRRNADTTSPHTPRQGSEQDKLDLEEDLEDLQDSVVKESRTRGRPIDSARAKRQQHLETLRCRRAGNKPEDTRQSESESESEDDSSASEESESDGTPTRQTARLRSQDSDVESSIASNEDLDKSDDEFVLADEELGAPVGADDIPLEFTRHAYKQTKEYFQDAVEWMVHNQLNPAFPRSSPRFRLAFSKLEDEVRGRAGSQLVSSAWTLAFRRALMARPYIEVTLFPAMEERHCDACNRSGHPASSDVKFSGKAYSLETLEPVTDEDIDGNNSDDARDRDRNGDIIPDEGARFFLGKHCRKMTNMAHTLIHWRFHLNEWVINYLENKGILGDEEILQRSRWSQRQKGRYATETLEMMLETGEIQKLWRDFHINLRAARESMSHG